MSAERATWLLSRAAHYRESGALELAKATAQAAQAEATLELAEQRRVASLIEYVKVAAESADPTNQQAVEYLAEITEQIRDGLGI